MCTHIGILIIRTGAVATERSVLRAPVAQRTDPREPAPAARIDVRVSVVFDKALLHSVSCLKIKEKKQSVINDAEL